MVFIGYRENCICIFQNAFTWIQFASFCGFDHFESKVLQRFSKSTSGRGLSDIGIVFDS